MTISYGDYDPTTPGELADGSLYDAAVRVFTKNFNLATDGDPAGGTTNPLHVGRFRKGQVIQPEFKIASGANLSAINFTLGTSSSAASFMAATAGPNATTASYHILPGKQGIVLTADTDLYLTPSGALPGTGVIVTTLYASHK